MSNKPAGKNIAQTVSALLSPVIAELGYEVWDIEYLKEGADWILRVTIDAPGGIGIDDCEKVHRAIDPLLDEADPIENSYDLEVTSAGLERELSLPRHFERYIGKAISVGLYAPRNGTKRLFGTLTAYNEGSITITVADGEITLGPKEYAKVETYYDFDQGKGKKKTLK